MGVISSLGDVSGVPAINRVTCNSCGLCAEACPTGVLSQGAEGIVIDPAATFGCIACGQCMMVCPTGSVTVTGRGISPEDLVPLPPAESRPSAEQLEALLLSRRSTRKFRDEEVPREVLDRIVAAGAMAPMGIPPWEVGVVAFLGRDKVRELASDVATLYAGILRFMDSAPVLTLMRPFLKKTTFRQMDTFILPLAREIVKARDAGDDKILNGAPAALLFHASPCADAADAFIACTYAMIAAESLGLGTTMIGCLSPPLARSKAVMKKYGLPEGHKPAIALILGYPLLRYQRAIRRRFQSVTYR